MRPPPRVVRRAVVDPLFVPLAVLMAAAFLLVAALSAVVAPLTPRRRVLRLAVLALAYVSVDLALVLGGAALWLRHPRRRGLEGERRWIAAHVRLLRWALLRLLAVARATVGFRVEIDPATRPLDGDDDPVLVLARHAGPGDSFSLVWLILTCAGRTPRVVLKEVLLWDPGLDVMLTRLSGCFLPSRSGAGDDTADRVAESAAGLHRGQALLIFPEGGNWTPARHRRAVRALWRAGRRRAARQAVATPHVLPPRPAGTAAALGARPDLDVVVVAHAGLDRLTGVRQVWDAVPVTATPMRVHWWRIRADDVPRREDGVADWLNDQWTDVARWTAPSPQ